VHPYQICKKKWKNSSGNLLSLQNEKIRFFVRLAERTIKKKCSLSFLKERSTRSRQFFNKIWAQKWKIILSYSLFYFNNYLLLDWNLPVLRNYQKICEKIGKKIAFFETKLNLKLCSVEHVPYSLLAASSNHRIKIHPLTLARSVVGRFIPIASFNPFLNYWSGYIYVIHPNWKILFCLRNVVGFVRL